MKTRVVDVTDSYRTQYYPQYKTWLFWRPFKEAVDYGAYIGYTSVSCDSLEDAKEYIKTAKTKNKAKIYIHNIDEQENKNEKNNRPWLRKSTTT